MSVDRCSEFHAALDLLASAPPLPNHLVSLRDVTRESMAHMMDVARAIEAAPPASITNVARGYGLGILFYQQSTRTRMSFEAAMLRLGGYVTGFADPKTTRAVGFYEETLEDVVRFSAEVADILVLRHTETGASSRAAAVSPVPLINAGDGYGEHPTQALGDLYHLRKHFGRLDGLCVGVIGHLGWRAHRSLVTALSLFDVHLAVLEPPGSVPPPDVAALLRARGTRVTSCQNVNEVLQLADAITTLGVYHSNFHAKFGDRGNDDTKQDRPTPESHRVTAAAVRSIRSGPTYWADFGSPRPCNRHAATGPLLPAGTGRTLDACRSTGAALQKEARMNRHLGEGFTPLETDQIFLITTAIQANHVLRDEVIGELRELVETSAYTEWAAGLAQRHPFDVESAFRKKALVAQGLVADKKLRLRINRVGDAILLTDGVWVDPRLRVFPFADESSAINRYCERRALFAGVDAAIDLATGSGNNLAHLTAGVPGFGMDVNPRALAYFQLNQLLNGRTRNVSCLNDIRRGFDDIHPFVSAERPLVLSNMPFGLAPTRDLLALTSHGGETGLALQRCAFEAVARFRRTPCGRRARVVMLGYSVGNAARNRWEMVDLAREILGETGLAWSILGDERLLRVDGQRLLANPSPVGEALHAAGGCQLYHDDPSAVRRIYAELSERLSRIGMPDLSYMIVELHPAI